MTALLALLPILLIVALMIGLSWSAAKAGVAGLIVALPIALLAFDYRGPEAAPNLPLALLGLFAEAGFTAATILWIVFPALWIHELQLKTEATETIRKSLSRLSVDPRLTALLIAWFFALFAEGAAGFGTPVALAAPILVGLGFPPIQAVSLALVGHAVGVSFGAVGTPVMAQLATSDLGPTALAGATALLHAGLGWTMALMLHRIVVQGEAGNGAAVGTAGWPWPMLAALTFLAPYALIAWLIGPELPTLGGALLGGAAFAWLVHRREEAGGEHHDDLPDGRRIVMAALPYLVLLALIVVTRLIPPLQTLLSEIKVGWQLFDGGSPGDDGFRGSFQPLYHPGTMLFLGLVIGGLVRRDSFGDFAATAKAAASRLPAVIIALLAMLTIARLMVHAGLIEALAEAAAATTGAAWPLFAPATGALGTFVTGSATASNILLTDFQLATASALALPALWMAAAQGFGAAVGNIICPHNIVAGNATVGLAGKEGPVLRLMLGPALLYAALGGVLVALLVYL
jgi:lactate permease